MRPYAFRSIPARNNFIFLCFYINQHRVSMRFSVNMVRISIVVSVLQSSEGPGVS